MVAGWLPGSLLVNLWFSYTKIDDEDAKTKMQKMLDMFEDNDDIQNVWHNWEMED